MIFQQYDTEGSLVDNIQLTILGGFYLEIL